MSNTIPMFLAEAEGFGDVFAPLVWNTKLGGLEDTFSVLSSMGEGQAYPLTILLMSKRIEWRL